MKGSAPCCSPLLKLWTGVIIFDDADASSLIRNIRPTIVVKGKHFEKQLLPEHEAIRESGAKLEYFPEY